jgi:hypothetical protein
MDWHLIYRDEADMHALAAELPGSQVASYRVFEDNYRAITYLLVERR